MDLIIALLILALVVIVAFYVIDLLGLPGNINKIAKLIIGLVALVYILQAVLPLLHLGALHLGLK